VDGADGSGGLGRLLGEGAAWKAVATTEKGKKRRMTGGRRDDAGGDVTRAPPGGDPARAR
jgi:hypothetical protein